MKGIYIPSFLWKLDIFASYHNHFCHPLSTAFFGKAIEIPKQINGRRKNYNLSKY